MAEGREPDSVPMDRHTQEDNRQHQTLQPYEEQQDDSAGETPEQHQALMPAKAVLPVSITAENVNQGETQNVVSGDQTCIQHVDRHIERNIERNIETNVETNIERNIETNIERNIETNIERNIETNIETQVVYNIEDRKKVIPTFNLESVTKQLQQEYLETRGKLPLLPGMPEEFARMEDLFVDLHVVEEEKKPTGVISKELRTYGDMVCITQEVEKGGRKEEKEVKRVLVRGPPGVGKSTALSKLAYDWACGKHGSPISKFQLLFVITINEINANIDLISVIHDQLLPNVSRQDVKDYLHSNASSVVFLFDGYDEATNHFHQSKNIKEVLCSKWLSEACVIVTTRPNQVGRFSQHYGPYLQVEILGFSDYERKKLYVQKFMETVQCNATEFMNQLHKSSHLTQIASIPIILSMLCLLWAEDHKLPSTVTTLYREVITHLAKHSYAKTQHKDLDLKHINNRIDSVLDDIGEVAIGGLFEDMLVFTSSEFGQTSLDEGCELGLVMKERKRSKLNVTYNVRFIHKTFQEICAAHFWASLIETEQNKFQKYLEKINQDNIFEMEYLLRFACGLNMKAAEKIIPHVVHIMCQHSQLRDDDGKVENIYENPCQQLPIVLLFEAESNNAEKGYCYNLHRHLKPVITCLRIQLSPWYLRVSNFQEILSAYISSQQSIRNERKDDSYLWLNDVEEVYLERDVIGKDTTAKLVCAMSKVTILHIDRVIIENLLNNDFSGTTLSILYLRNVECELNELSQFLSTIPSLSKFVLVKVLLHGNLSGVVSLPTVEKLHIENNICWAPCITPLLDVFIVNRFFVTPLIQLQCKFVTCNANRFAQFASCMSSLTKLTLHRLSLIGELSSAIHLPAVKELCINESGKACQAILRGYGQVADEIRRDKEKSHSNQELIAINTCIPAERMAIHGLNLLPDGVCNLIKAMKYMLHLRCLDLQCESLRPSDFEQLFDALVDASKNMNTCSHVHECTSGVGSGSGLLLEELCLSNNEIGVSIGKFAIAYGYMPHLKCLKLDSQKLLPMQALHYEKLFDSFIEAVQSRNGSLELEVLDLSGHQICDSAVKLSQAYRYMKHLKCLNLNMAFLDPSQCAQLFDGFISVGQSKREPHDVQTTVLKTHSLALEELRMSRNDVGNSVEKLVLAYRYMTRLKILGLSNTNLTQSHCAVLFDGLIAAGKMLTKNESSSNGQGDASSIPQSGLSIERLGLSGNKIGKSADKLLEALTYMSNLKSLGLWECKLHGERMARIHNALKAINKTFRKNYTDVWIVKDI